MFLFLLNNIEKISTDMIQIYVDIKMFLFLLNNIEKISTDTDMIFQKAPM